MTSVKQPVSEEDSSISKDANDNISFHQCRNGLRSKEKKIRSKFNRDLKRKLKKYKFRQDGKEDQEILDVSVILESSLTIISPGEQKSSAELELEQLRIPNYLFKMGRKKQSVIVAEKSLKKTEEIVVNENGCVQISPTTEEKKQTNAFKLLMDSRNKSIGSNSPGKEKPTDETEMQEFIEKKNIKAKRNIMLEKMAESKGSLKKKEIEANQEKIINKKMEKRAEKLKCMLLNKEPKPASEKFSNLKNGRTPLNSIKTEVNEKLSNKSVKSLQLVNMFTDTVELKISPEKKLITKEDKQFLSKLSPSLKRKESMLSYFKKVDKESDCTNTDSENDNIVIKVKLNTKPKKKVKKKKLSLNKGTVNDLPISQVETPEPKEEMRNGESETKEEIVKVEEISSNERRKRKRDKDHCDVGSMNNIDTKPDDGRPRRSIKRPVKYNEDAALSSSDEELHIFTPKKKKHSISKNKITDTIIDLSLDKDEDTKSKKTKADKNNKKTSKAKEEKMQINKKPVKLAPIFSSKSQIDPAALEAKQKFLQSGVPEQLKKMKSKQVDKNIVSNCFLKVVHIQQLEPADHIIFPTNLVLHDISIDNSKYPHNQDKLSFRTLLNMGSSQNAFSLSSKLSINTQTVLHNLKEKYPRYPVYRTYRLLRGKKKGDYKNDTNYLDLDNSVEILNASIDNQNVNPEQLSWSDKYKPLAASQIIGNFESVKELRKWLVSWTENNLKSKANSNDSDSSDYYQSEGDSKDSVKSNNNLLVLSGPVGSGKTSSVYAIAAELAIKVIEVNASSKRTGKIMLQDLQEATQSHKVNRGASSNENSQKSQEFEIVPLIATSVKKRGRPKKTEEILKKPVLKKSLSKEKPDTDVSASQDGRTCMSLILIDDADIVFDQDDGFCSAIMQLVHCSKRPVILITSSLSCPHLQRFIQSSKILKMSALLPNILGTWLDIMCLADSGMCWPGVGSETLNFFNGDIRKTINYLQFYVCSQEQPSSQEIECSQNTECMKVNLDENSSTSWAGEGEDRNLNIEPIELNDTAIARIGQSHSKHFKSPAELFDIWWSIPKLLNISNKIENSSSSPNDKAPRSLESISTVLDSLSLCDYYSHNLLQNKSNLTSDPWFSQECHSVSEMENFEYFNRDNGTTNEIEDELAKCSIRIAQAELGCATKIDFDYPGMAQHRQRDRIVSRHNTLTGYLSTQAVLDRKALALDYWSSCRAICRIEKSKTDTNSKRNNRFCHYLKSLSVLCKNDSFDKLANSLSPSENS